MSLAPPNEFRWTVRVYFEDTDAAGIVYYANYLKFFERCRTEWLRALGIEQQALAEDEQRQFVVVSLRTDFMRPARLDDAIELTARITHQARSYVVFEQRALRSTAAGEELLAAAEVKVACVNQRTLRPTSLPEVLLHALQQLAPAAPATEHAVP
jgi:acyl-CoA thioester hydrolase